MDRSEPGSHGESSGWASLAPYGDWPCLSMVAHQGPAAIPADRWLPPKPGCGQPNPPPGLCDTWEQASLL